MKDGTGESENRRVGEFAAPPSRRLTGSASQQHGNRKSTANRESHLILMLGFVVAAWMHAPTELFVAFVVGIGGTSASFMWGNAQEHKAGDGQGKS